MSPKKNATTTDELHRHLAYLKLPFMREHVEQIARQAARSQWSHVDFLARLVEGEAADRQDRAQQRRVQQARFPVLKTLEQFDFTWPAEINRLQVQDLFRLKFIPDNANAILIHGMDNVGERGLTIERIVPRDRLTPRYGSGWQPG